MLMAEWKLEEALVVERQEGREEGMRKGMEKGIERGIEKSVKDLLKFGMEAEKVAGLLKLPLEVVRRYSRGAGGPFSL